MHRRCARAEGYVDRGIVVCEKWASFEAFYADMGDVPQGYSLDRIDNDGDYTFANCRWTDDKTQRRNQRRSVRVEYLGRTKTIAEWGEETGIDGELLARRIKYGWSIERVLTTPVRKYTKTYEAGRGNQDTAPERQDVPDATGHIETSAVVD